MNPAALFRITRPANSLFAGIAAIIGYLIATGTLIPQAWILLAIVALITAAGNAINDFFDAEIDAVNRPDRPIPSGAISRTTAHSYAILLFLAGIGLCLFTTPLCIAIAIINSALLYAYAARLKRLPLLGNVAVSYLSGSMFIFGGSLNGPGSLLHVIPVAAITFSAMLARELFKAAEDIEGDRNGGADTFPIRAGIPVTAKLAYSCAAFAVAISLIPFLWWGPVYLVGISIVDGIIIIAAFRGAACTTADCIKKSGAATLLKIGFFASLPIFTVSALFL
ncbi:MAG: Digeranylgeranylglyceryl phosphate synthase [Methanoregula sp. SKADARSKE-2]|nr:MAG: Digeranylgeranylglyceryl phosphate synthase [Methanoregula sp. SKADARSKE-2]